MKKWLATAFVFLAVSIGSCQRLRSMPEGLSFAGQPRAANDVALVTDTSWLDENGQRHLQQGIFDELFSLIAGAERLILLDMFLFNDFQGSTPETTRALAGELTDALIARKQDRPGIDIVVITDPINTIYGGATSPYLERLKAAGIKVVITDLHRLRDSNPVYSLFWRIFLKPFGNAEASTLPNPIGPGRVSVRSYLALANFKANHRKILIADQGSDYVGFVSSANPHDGSSAHRNAALRFTGPAVADLLASENAVLNLSNEPPIALTRRLTPAHTDTTIQVVTEAKIRDAVVSRLDRTSAGERVDIMMFYLSERTVIRALKRAKQRGVELRLLLDANKDAFGREKNGIPNRPVAHELTRAGIPVRWCTSAGEQCHSKMVIIHSHNGRSTIISGSANLTRRNLADFNLETDVVVEGSSTAPVITAAEDFFADAWLNRRNRQYSVDYETYAEDSWWQHALYRFMEWSGVSTF